MRRISELTTDNAIDAFCEIIPYVEEITTDEELMGEIKGKLNLSEGATKFEFYTVLVGKITKIAPILLKKRRNAIYNILSVFNEKTVEEIGNQNFVITLSQIVTLVRDKQVMELFTSHGELEDSK